jgi:hypothetical protein
MQHMQARGGSTLLRVDVLHRRVLLVLLFDGIVINPKCKAIMCACRTATRSWSQLLLPLAYMVMQMNAQRSVLLY